MSYFKSRLISMRCRVENYAIGTIYSGTTSAAASGATSATTSGATSATTSGTEAGAGFKGLGIGLRLGNPELLKQLSRQLPSFVASQPCQRLSASNELSIGIIDSKPFSRIVSSINLGVALPRFIRGNVVKRRII
jgi:hypothetical protein